MVYLFRKRKHTHSWENQEITDSTPIFGFHDLDQLSKVAKLFADQAVPTLQDLENHFNKEVDNALTSTDPNNKESELINVTESGGASSTKMITLNDSTNLDETSDSYVLNENNCNNFSNKFPTLSSSYPPLAFTSSSSTSLLNKADNKMEYKIEYGQRHQETSKLKRFFTLLRNYYKESYDRVVIIFLDSLQRFLLHKIDQLALTSILHTLLKDSSLIDEFFAMVFQRNPQPSVLTTTLDASIIGGAIATENPRIGIASKQQTVVADGVGISGNGGSMNNNYMSSNIMKASSNQRNYENDNTNRIANAKALDILPGDYNISNSNNSISAVLATTSGMKKAECFNNLGDAYVPFYDGSFLPPTAQNNNNPLTSSLLSSSFGGYVDSRIAAGGSSSSGVVNANSSGKLTGRGRGGRGNSKSRVSRNSNSSTNIYNNSTNRSSGMNPLNRITVLEKVSNNANSQLLWTQPIGSYNDNINNNSNNNNYYYTPIYPTTSALYSQPQQQQQQPLYPSIAHSSFSSSSSSSACGVATTVTTLSSQDLIDISSNVDNDNNNSSTINYGGQENSNTAVKDATALKISGFLNELRMAIGGELFSIFLDELTSLHSLHTTKKYNFAIKKANSIRSIFSAHIDLKSRFELLFPINAVSTLSDLQVPQTFLANATIALVLHSRLPDTSVSLPTTLTSLPTVPNKAMPPISLDQHKILIMEQSQLQKQQEQNQRQESKIQINAYPTTSLSSSSSSSSSSIVYNTSTSNNKANNNNYNTIIPPPLFNTNKPPCLAPTTIAVSSSSYSLSSTTGPKAYLNKNNNDNSNNSKHTHVEAHNKINTNPINNNNNNSNNSYGSNGLLPDTPGHPLSLVPTKLSIDQQYQLWQLEKQEKLQQHKRNSVMPYVDAFNNINPASSLNTSNSINNYNGPQPTLGLYNNNNNSRNSSTNNVNNQNKIIKNNKTYSSIGGTDRQGNPIYHYPDLGMGTAVTNKSASYNNTTSSNSNSNRNNIFSVDGNSIITKAALDYLNQQQPQVQSSNKQVCYPQQQQQQPTPTSSSSSSSSSSIVTTNNQLPRAVDSKNFMTSEDMIRILDRHDASKAATATATVESSNNQMYSSKPTSTLSSSSTSDMMMTNQLPHTLNNNNNNNNFFNNSSNNVNSYNRLAASSSSSSPSRPIFHNRIDIQQQPSSSSSSSSSSSLMPATTNNSNYSNSMISSTTFPHLSQIYNQNSIQNQQQNNNNSMSYNSNSNTYNNGSNTHGDNHSMQVSNDNNNSTYLCTKAPNTLLKGIDGESSSNNDSEDDDDDTELLRFVSENRNSNKHDQNDDDNNEDDESNNGNDKDDANVGADQ